MAPMNPGSFGGPPSPGTRRAISPPSLLLALRRGFLGHLAVQDRDMCAGLQLVLSVDYDLLVGP
jgi:hypothetical protein